jgi:hypothetical protein
MLFFGEGSLRRALHEYVAHYHTERNQQGKSNVLPFRGSRRHVGRGDCDVASDLAGLRYYHQDAA